MTQQHEAKMTPQQHAGHIASVLQQAKQACRADLQRVSDPKAQALFETTAEVIDGLCKALSDYQHGSEAIWRSDVLPHSTQHGVSIVRREERA